MESKRAVAGMLKLQKCPPAAKRALFKARFLLAAPLLSLSFATCDTMPEKKIAMPDAAKEERAKGPGVAVAGAQSSREALHAIRDMEMGQSSDIVFGFLKSNAPLQEKTAVVDAFLYKYGETPSGPEERNPALDELAHQASVTFGTSFFGSLESLKKDSPELLSYMQALAYGFAKCGQDGFERAVDMVSAMDLVKPGFFVPGFSDRKTSLAAPFADMVCGSLRTSKSFDREAGIDYISEKLHDAEVSPHTRAALINLAKLVQPESLPGMLRDAKIDDNAKYQVAAGIRNLLRDSGIPKHVKASLEKSMESILSDSSVSESTKQIIRKFESR
ncbi:hypothetical protein GF412_04115 [Candidatus Micrarchaeota archaeon]|nr:hypothetical protein [Candidatus Micrarchaeota archaeon]MBD3418135.1 hypothetical protein [Candidatus Micrarchaeota archaeon]